MMITQSSDQNYVCCNLIFLTRRNIYEDKDTFYAQEARLLPIECCLALLKTNNEQVSYYLAEFKLRYV